MIQDVASAFEHEDLIDRIARAIDPDAFSAEVKGHFARAAQTGNELPVEAIKWMPRIIGARQAASRVFDVLRPTQFMLEAAEALINTKPDATPDECFQMMMYAERHLAVRKVAPGIELEDVDYDEYVGMRM